MEATRFGSSILLLVAALLSASCSDSDSTGAPPAEPMFSNPVLYADYSDPDVIRSGDSYYLVSSSFHLSPGLPILRSQDLVNWTIVSHVLPTLPFAADYDRVGARYGGGPWAPSIREHDGRFYVYWATPHEGIFMASALQPEGAWTEPVTVIAEAGLEDPCPFWDDDGTAWLVHSRVGAGPLILHRMTPDGTQVLDGGKVIAEDKERLPILEGPKLYKREGWYYIFAPIGGVATGPQAVGRAAAIDGPYEWRDVLLPGGPLELQGPHQGGWVETPSGEGWFMHFNSTGAFGRIVHLQPVSWRDGWPIIGEPIAGEFAGYPVAGGAYPDTGSEPGTDTLQATDDFSSSALGLQWSWNHNPDNQKWSLSERPGYLRLQAGRADTLNAARNTLTQILIGPVATYTTSVDLRNMSDGQRAGLTLFNAQPGWIGVVRDGGGFRVVVSQAGKELPIADLNVAEIELRAVVTEDQTASYSYSVDGGETFLSAGEPAELVAFAWWKGTRPGLFTFNKIDDSGSVDIDWFRVD